MTIKIKALKILKSKKKTLTLTKTLILTHFLSAKTEKLMRLSLMMNISRSRKLN